MFFSSKVRRQAAEKEKHRNRSSAADRYVIEGPSARIESLGVMALKFDSKSDAARKMQAACFAKLKEIW